MRAVNQRRASFSTQSKLRRQALQAAPIFVAEPLEARRLLSVAAPALLAISRATPADQTADAATTDAVTFNQPVTGVTAADFQLAGSSSAAAAALVVSPVGGYQSVYAVTVSSGSSNATAGLNLVNTAGIVSAGGIHMASNTASFGSPVAYAVGSDPIAVAVGDFNADGNLDLAVANYNDGTVSVLAGNGDGSFQAAVDLTTGSFPGCVVVGDFNGDGKPDLATAAAMLPSASAQNVFDTLTDDNWTEDGGVGYLL